MPLYHIVKSIHPLEFQITTKHQSVKNVAGEEEEEEVKNYATLF